MSDNVCVGQVEEAPVVWEITNIACTTCGQLQYKGFRGGEFLGVCCPNGHWNTPPFVIETAQPAPVVE